MVSTECKNSRVYLAVCGRRYAEGSVSDRGSTKIWSVWPVTDLSWYVNVLARILSVRNAKLTVQDLINCRRLGRCTRALLNGVALDAVAYKIREVG